MSYRVTAKAQKVWSDNAHAAKARKRIENTEEREPYFEINHYIRITVQRTATNEDVVFECFEGDRIDNYRVYCDGKYLGIQSITTFTKNLRKALPRFRRMNS